MTIIKKVDLIRQWFILHFKKLDIQARIYVAINYCTDTVKHLTIYDCVSQSHSCLFVKYSICTGTPS